MQNCGYGRNSSPTDRLISVAADPPDLPDGMILSCFTKTYGLNPITRYEYDDNSSLRHQYDPGDLHTEFVYDELNRKKEHIQPDGLATSYTYDEEGNIKSTTDPNKNLITYDYDGLNRETDVYYPEDPDSPFISTVSIHTDYDGNNNVTMITETKKGQERRINLKCRILNVLKLP
ncbi:MAG: RHS repeat protein [Gammaproteobacteria bacterium]|nr:RHS repeat protein [Gammaproteobacteria bacterium]